jgi:Right handed beta helix region
MKSSGLIAVLIIAVATPAAFAQRAPCLVQKRNVVYIRKGANDDMVKAVRDNVRTPNTTVLLAPDVDIDFSAVVGEPSNSPLIVFAHCVTLASYLPEDGPPGSGRTPHSVGPVLRYGTNKNRTKDPAFLWTNCSGDPADEAHFGDGARISGIRIFGPDFNDHFSGEKGIYIQGCHDVEISNCEIAGWGEAAIAVDDFDHVSGIPTQEPSKILVRIHDNYLHHNQHSSTGGHATGYGVEVSKGAFAEIFQNVFDYNRHSVTAGGTAGGYRAMRNLILKGGGFHNGTFLGIVYERYIHVFDVHGTDNCWAWWWGVVAGLLVLAGAIIGGIVGGPFGAAIGAGVGALFGAGAGVILGTTDVAQHMFNCGDAGFSFTFAENTFQYNKTTDIKIRGKPKGQGPAKSIIDGNIFVRSDQDAAIDLESPDAVEVTSTNQFGTETFGQYGVCDIDGDGIDDLFLTTGVTWWFSSAGQYPWSFLKSDTAVLKDLKLGDVDGDGRCDVIKDAGAGAWMVSRGATGDWQPLGNFLAPLSDTHLGRFDPQARDYRPGVRRPPTHAFWRGDNGFWFVTPLSQPNGWTLVESSSFPLADLRFGDFTGDSVTDVLGNEGGHWAISESARGQWRTLNPTLNDAVKNQNIFIANMDAGDNVDDILRLDVEPTISGGGSYVTLKLTWQRSQNGITPWTPWKSYVFTYDRYSPDYVSPGYGFVGQFGTSPGASALIIDPNRIGHFYSPAQGKDRQEWESLFSY